MILAVLDIKVPPLILRPARMGGRYGGFCFNPNISPDEIFAPEGPKSQAGSGAGRLDLPTKYKVPAAVLRMKIGVELRPGRVGGWSRPMRRKRNERKENFKVYLNYVSKNLIGQKIILINFSPIT